MDPQTSLQARIVELEAEVQRLALENGKLLQKARQADSANQAKSVFLAMISHEIRTPMNGVIGISELLLDTELQPRQKHFAQLIRTSAASLLILINNLLDFSKIEANKMSLDIEPFDLRTLVEQLLTLYQVTGRRKGLTVTAEIDPALSRLYLGDSYRLRQVLVNLLGNAIKFTENGTILLRVTREKTGSAGDLLRFEVQDSGVGIAADAIGKLFLPFSQVDSSSTRRYGGSGLGLSICAKLIKLMNGEFGVQSDAGKGATFWFTLSFEVVSDSLDTASAVLPTLPEAGGAGYADIDSLAVRETDGSLRLLIVDDEETNRIVMAETFRNTGVTVVTACNGQEAIDACRSTRFNLIFMDCQMPEVDGFAATEAILEASAGDLQDPPAIIALTADATAVTKTRCEEVGMVDYLVKPIDFNKLQGVLSHWLPELHTSVVPGIGEKTLEAASSGQNAGSVVIDTAILERLREHVGDIGPVVGIFLSSLERRVGELEQAVQRSDAEAIKKVAHTMKGSSSQFGAQELTHLCQLAENMGKSGNIAQIGRIFEQIVGAVRKVQYFFTEQLDYY